VLSVKPHAEFKRQANDLVYELTINLAQAALGADVEVPTLDAEKPRVALKIPPGTQHGRALRVKGMGVPYLRNYSRGDLRVLVRVAVPQHLTDEQRRILQELARTFESTGDKAGESADGRDGVGRD